MNTRILFGILAAVALMLVHSQSTWADGDEDRSPNWSKPRVEARVESRSDGVYVQIEVRQSTPGVRQSAPPHMDSGRPSATRGSISTVASTNSTSSRGRATSSTAASGRTWTDATGIHHVTADGRRITLTPPLISSATRESWMRELQQHPNATPYLLYVNDEFGGVVWIDQSARADNLRFGTPPDTPPQVAVSAGGGASTDPREVALDALAHVPLPNIQIRMNPSLGLVALPGWFWVEGYNGQPFGTSRTVEVPPEVGPEVPVDVVPADDPRRRGSSFTVEVRVWASRYEWSFGDGAGLVTQSLGKPYPAESDITHTYEHSSLLFPGGFPVRLTVEYRAEYRVNGGAPQPLPPVRRTYEAGYRVQEVQPVLTNR